MTFVRLILLASALEKRSWAHKPFSSVDFALITTTWGSWSITWRERSFRTLKTCILSKHAYFGKNANMSTKCFIPAQATRVCRSWGGRVISFSTISCTRLMFLKNNYMSQLKCDVHEHIWKLIIFSWGETFFCSDSIHTRGAKSSGRAGRTQLRQGI